MIREVIVDQSMIDIHRYLRRIGARLIRLIPKTIAPHSEAYVALYIMEATNVS